MKIRILFSSIAAVALLAGCGGASVSDVADDVAGGVADSVDNAVTFNSADVMFAQMMIPHHEQAIEMSDIALDPTVGASDVVKSLASRIKGAQDPEIIVMKGFLTAWKMSTTMDSSMDHGSAMSGMLSAQDIAELSALRGADFDRAWMAGMIAHHEGAIEMAAEVVKGGKNTAVRALANAITSAQDTEIAEMKTLLD
jgi:uncharacterized protein (DUF305 family)